MGSEMCKLGVCLLDDEILLLVLGTWYSFRSSVDERF